MRSYKLGFTHTLIFDDYLIIGFDKQWLSLNNDNPIKFSAEVKKGKLILSGSLERLDRTKEVDTNAM